MWTIMLRLLKKHAQPIICKQGFQAVNQEEDVDMHPRSQFPFILDWDKGFISALKGVFPDNIEMSCSKQIKASVTMNLEGSVEKT